MSLNIIDLIKGQLGPALVSQAATQLGESESGISKAISGLLPAVVGGLANNASNPSVLDSITGAASSGLLGNLLGGSSNNSLISTVLSAIFGDKVGGLVNLISGFSGVNSNNTSSLLNLVTGAALGSVGKYAADNNLDRSGLASLLGDQKGIVSTLLPAGLSLGSLGLGNWFGGDDTEKVKVTSYDEPKVEVNRGGSTHVNVDRNDNNGGGSIWRWLLPLLLLLLAGYFLWKQCGNKEATDATTTTETLDTAVVEGDTATAVVGDRTVIDIDLNGTALKGFAGGMESRMIDFLKAGSYDSAADDEALKDVWYDFDNVNFKIGSSTELEAGSEGQIQNLAEILKAFPTAKIKIGGYTDKTGNEADNVKLSDARAEFIKAELGKLGVGAQVIDAEGYGSQFATVPAEATNEERAVDRKMAVRFAK